MRSRLNAPMILTIIWSIFVIAFTIVMCCGFNGVVEVAATIPAYHTVAALLSVLDKLAYVSMCIIGIILMVTGTGVIWIVYGLFECACYIIVKIFRHLEE